MTKFPRPDDVSEEVWADFLTLRKAKKAPITDTALRGFRREAEKAGISLQQAIEVSCTMGWQGFKAEWYQRQNPSKQAGFYEQEQAAKRQRWEEMTGMRWQPPTTIPEVHHELIERSH